MTHISGTVSWNNATYHGFCILETQLILLLDDGTYRRMNLINWEGSFSQTLKNLIFLKSADAIQYGTWSNYDSTIWFCDVKPI